MNKNNNCTRGVWPFWHFSSLYLQILKSVSEKTFRGWEYKLNSSAYIEVLFQVKV